MTTDKPVTEECTCRLPDPCATTCAVCGKPLRKPVTERDRVRDKLLPFAELGRPEGDILAFHDLPEDVVLFSNSGVSITVGDVRGLQDYLKLTAQPEPGKARYEGLSIRRVQADGAGNQGWIVCVSGNEWARDYSLPHAVEKARAKFVDEIVTERGVTDTECEAWASLDNLAAELMEDTAPPSAAPARREECPVHDLQCEVQGAVCTCPALAGQTEKKP